MKTLYPGIEERNVDRLIKRATLDARFQAACREYAQRNGSSEAIMLCAVNAFETTWKGRDEQALRRDAIRAVLTWIASNGAPDALETIDLSVLTDADIETLFRGERAVVRIPFLGGVT